MKKVWAFMYNFVLISKNVSTGPSQNKVGLQLNTDLGRFHASKGNTTFFMIQLT